jgi:hypothetical protein
VPALRERREDIPDLVTHFVKLFSRRMGKPSRYKVEARLERLQGQRRENRKRNSEKDSDTENSQDPQFCETKPNGRASDERAPQGVGFPEQEPDEVVSPPIKVDIAEES